MTTPTNEELMTQLGVTAQQAAELVQYFEVVREGIGDNMGIEYGSNANGKYIKIPGGGLIFRKNVPFTSLNVETVWGSLYQSGDIELGSSPYPLVGDVSLSLRASIVTSGLTLITGTTKGFQSSDDLGAATLIRGVPYTGGASGSIHVTGIGSWK